MVANNPMSIQMRYSMRYARWHRWVFSMLMIIMAGIVLLGGNLVPRFINYQMASYGAIHTVAAEDGAYCPGDILYYTAEIERKKKGPINIREQWCRVGGDCAVSLAVEWPSYIDEERPPEIVNGARTIPHIRTMKPGQTWKLVHSSFPPGRPEADDAYRVFFSLADSCEAWSQ